MYLATKKRQFIAMSAAYYIIETLFLINQSQGCWLDGLLVEKWIWSRPLHSQFQLESFWMQLEKQRTKKVPEQQTTFLTGNYHLDKKFALKLVILSILVFFYRKLETFHIFGRWQGSCRWFYKQMYKVHTHTRTHTSTSARVWVWGIGLFVGGNNVWAYVLRAYVCH